MYLLSTRVAASFVVTVSLSSRPRTTTHYGTASTCSPHLKPRLKQVALHVIVPAKCHLERCLFRDRALLLLPMVAILSPRSALERTYFQCRYVISSRVSSSSVVVSCAQEVRCEMIKRARNPIGRGETTPLQWREWSMNWSDQIRWQWIGTKIRLGWNNMDDTTRLVCSVVHYVVCWEY